MRGKEEPRTSKVLIEAGNHDYPEHTKSSKIRLSVAENTIASQVVVEEK
jgi:hypothetical protein